MLGVLEIAGRGSGFLRQREASYLPSQDDVHVGERLIRQFGLRTGDEIEGSVRAGNKGRNASLATITAVQGKSPDLLRERPEFSRLAAVHPNEQLRLENPAGSGRAGRCYQPGHRSPVPPGQGPAGPDRGSREGGEDDGVAVHRSGSEPQLPRRRSFHSAGGRAARGSLRDGSGWGRRGDCLELRQSGPAACFSRRADPGARPPPGGARG